MIHNTAMRHPLLARLVIGALAVALVGTASAQTAPSSAPATSVEQPAEAPPPDPSMSADEFLLWVAAGNALQLDLGALASSRAASQEVRDLAKRMVTNHTAIVVIVGRIAARRGVALPTTAETADRAVLERLRGLEGEAFDKAYLQFLADRSAWTLARFRWQSEHCTDDDLKPFALGTTPIMGTHARITEALNAEVNREELRLAAERKAAEQKAAAIKRAEEAAAAAAAAQRQVTPKRSRSLGGAK